LFEEAEVLFYFSAFWLFIFSAKFRSEFISRWRAASARKKFFLGIEMASSVFAGVVLPALLVWWLV